MTKLWWTRRRETYRKMIVFFVFCLACSTLPHPPKKKYQPNKLGFLPGIPTFPHTHLFAASSSDFSLTSKIFPSSDILRYEKLARWSPKARDRSLKVTLGTPAEEQGIPEVIFIPWSSRGAKKKNRLASKRVPSLKKNSSPPKNGGFPSSESPFPGVYFQGQAVSFRECKVKMMMWISPNIFGVLKFQGKTAQPALESSLKRLHQSCESCGKANWLPSAISGWNKKMSQKFIPDLKCACF